MRILGLVYLYVFSSDALLSILSSFIPNLERLSNIVSTPVILFSVIIFVLSCINKLNHKRAFMLLSGYYLCLFVVGIIIGFHTFFKLGPAAIPSENILHFLAAQYFWYWPFHWISMAIWCLLSIYGFVKITKSNN